MGIKIRWTDINQVAPVNFKIYRSQSEINIAAPGVALATVGSGIREYDDTTAVRNTRYYYRVSCLNALGEEFFSDHIIAGYYPDTGPGNNSLRRGNYEFGYFDKIAISDFLTPAEIYAMCGSPAGTLHASATHWFKVAYKGKVLFFPNSSIVHTCAFNTLWNLGLVYGDLPQEQWNPNAFGGSTGRALVAQNKIITRQTKDYRVRLPSARPDNQRQLTDAAANAVGGDIDKLLLPFLSGTYPTFGFQSNPKMADDVVAGSGNTTAILQADFSGTSLITRTLVTANVQTATPATVAPTAASQWLPILELVL